MIVRDDASDAARLDGFCVADMRFASVPSTTYLNSVFTACCGLHMHVLRRWRSSCSDALASVDAPAVDSVAAHCTVLLLLRARVVIMCMLSRAIAIGRSVGLS